MTAKRALVVDDSRSARAFLAKLLESELLQVDASETAEQAIEYLTSHRPDVIFMDHLMPGMDGFQAVQVIKSNPRTADIPILMYTSQEGELYLGQARALGAVGVLPKTVSAADVRVVLQQLNLQALPETRTVAVAPDVLNAAVAAAAAANTVEVPAPPPAVDVIARGELVELLKGEVGALRSFVAESLEAHSQRTASDVRNLLREALPPAPEPPRVEPEHPRHSPVAWLLALAASVAAAVLATLMWQSSRQFSQMRDELADAKATVAELTSRLVPAPVAQSLSLSAPGAPPSAVARVPFGEAPFAGARVELLREFVARRVTEGAAGTVEVRRYAGRFCLARTNSGLTVAEGATPHAKCDLVADATDSALGGAEAESVAFANAVAELRKQHGALISLDIAEGRGEVVLAEYPDVAGNPPHAVTAGEWNAAAEANNRVEMRWRPKESSGK